MHDDDIKAQHVAAAVNAAITHPPKGTLALGVPLAETRTAATLAAALAWSNGFRYGLDQGRQTAKRISDQHIREHGLRIELTHNPGPHPRIVDARTDDSTCRDCGNPYLRLVACTGDDTLWCPRCNYVS